MRVNDRSKFKFVRPYTVPYNDDDRIRSSVWSAQKKKKTLLVELNCCFNK
jgi:hypothetical protein